MISPLHSFTLKKEHFFRLGIDLHRPSLVQHVPAPSTWGGMAHRAIDFDPFYGP